MGKAINQFGPQTLQEIGYYVYLLVDPRDNTIIYVGKSENNRVFNHEEKVRKDFNPDNDKEVRIKDILDAGLNVEKYIVRYQLTEEQAFIVESVLINLLGGGKGDYVPFKFELSNIQGGHQMSTNKIMTVEQLDVLYSSKPLSADEITDRVMCININKAYSRDGDVYEAVRAAWRISQKKANQCDYVLAEYKNPVCGIFKVDEKGWYHADDGKRFQFDGYEVTDPAVLERYMNKQLPPKAKGSQNPIRYFNVK